MADMKRVFFEKVEEEDGKMRGRGHMACEVMVIRWKRVRIRNGDVIRGGVLVKIWRV